MEKSCSTRRRLQRGLAIAHLFAYRELDPETSLAIKFQSDVRFSNEQGHEIQL
jgi:hypothetical protein